MDLLLVPGRDLTIALFGFGANQLTIGDCHELSGHAHPNFGGCQLPGKAKQGNQKREIFVFALSPDLNGLVGIPIVWCDEVEAALRLVDPRANYQFDFLAGLCCLL